MKIPQPKVIKLALPVLVVLSIFACSKDTDLLADYVISDAYDAAYLSGIVMDDYFVSASDNPMVLDVLYNDGFPNPDKVKIIDVTPPSNGSVVVNDDNTLTYTPGADPSESTSETPEKKEGQTPTDTQPEEPDSNSEPATPKESTTETNDTEETEADEETETHNDEPKTQEPGTETNEKTEDSLEYTVAVTDEDDTVTTQTGTVTVITNHDYGVLKAFPSAYGAGSSASGGRGGLVYHVTNLNNSGKGSFRDAVSKGNRTIVFDVSGTIELTEDLRINADNLTIAGQTAPVGGISITGKHVYFNNNDNLIIRYIRFRPVWRHTSFGIQDGVNFTRVTNAIIDHCSVAFGVDEAISFIGSTDGVYATDKITMQRTLSAYSSKGTIMGYTNYTDHTPRGTPGGDFSVNQNMWVHISHRFPLVVTHDRADAINNVVHNWLYKLTPLNQSSNVKFNQINNYWQRGCLSNVIKNKQINQMDYDWNIQQLVYNAGNIINGEFTDANADNSVLWVYWLKPSPSGDYMERVEPEYFTQTPFPQLGHSFKIKTARETFVDVTSDVGANAVLDGSGHKIQSFDKLDSDLIKDVKNNVCFSYAHRDDRSKYQAYIDYRNSVSGVPINQHSADYDSDRDGMPDVWEKSRGLDPTKMDHNGDLDGNGYTNLEEYINLVDF